MIGINSIADLSYNSLDEPEVMEVLARMESLHVLNMIGNPLVRKTVDWRRNMIHKCQVWSDLVQM